MASKIPGYHGQLLEIDLTTKTTKIVDLDPKLAQGVHRRPGDGQQDAARRVRAQLGQGRSLQPGGAAAVPGGPVCGVPRLQGERRLQVAAVGRHHRIAGQRRLHLRAAFLRLRRHHPQGKGQLADLPDDFRRQGGVQGRVEDVGEGNSGGPRHDHRGVREPNVPVLHRTRGREPGEVCRDHHGVVPGGGTRRRRGGDGVQEPQGHRLQGHRAGAGGGGPEEAVRADGVGAQEPAAHPVEHASSTARPAGF